MPGTKRIPGNALAKTDGHDDISCDIKRVERGEKSLQSDSTQGRVFATAPTALFMPLPSPLHHLQGRCLQGGYSLLSGLFPLPRCTLPAARTVPQGYPPFRTWLAESSLARNAGKLPFANLATEATPCNNSKGWANMSGKDRSVFVILRAMGRSRVQPCNPCNPCNHTRACGPPWSSGRSIERQQPLSHR